MDSRQSAEAPYTAQQNVSIRKPNGDVIFFQGGFERDEVLKLLNEAVNYGREAGGGQTGDPAPTVDRLSVYDAIEAYKVWYDDEFEGPPPTRGELERLEFRLSAFARAASPKGQGEGAPAERTMSNPGNSPKEEGWTDQEIALQRRLYYQRVINEPDVTSAQEACDGFADGLRYARDHWKEGRSGWIPVSERLPDIHEDTNAEAGYVILLMQHERWKPDIWKTVKGSRVIVEDAWYWADEEGEIIDDADELITHWMPLPDPPPTPTTPEK